MKSSVGTRRSSRELAINVSLKAKSNSEPCIHIELLKSSESIFSAMRYCVANADSLIRKYSCIQCNSKSIFGCLTCVSFACQQHLSSHDHILWFDLQNSTPYCLGCRSYIFNVSYTPKLNLPLNAESHIVDKGYLGLRGFYNLGNTCYMNSVLHPLLTFLNSFFLQNLTPLSGIAYDFGQLCQNMLNDNTPYNPHSFLVSAWSSMPMFASYDQHDAHEFYICMFDVLHCSLARNVPHNQQECGCVLHKLCSGLISSNVTCGNCSKVSSKREQMIDLSLDTTFGEPILNVKSRKKYWADTTLENCLDRFTHSETLATTDSFFCSSCSTHAVTSKQLTIHILPKILVVHFKRFEHGSKKLSTKVDNFVQFPLELDMKPYVSAEHCNEKTKYNLFGVVEHIGTIDSGHYLCYVRKRDYWFKFDDAWVISASASEVLKTNAYILFYEKEC